jgi:hypothetical protein
MYAIERFLEGRGYALMFVTSWDCMLHGKASGMNPMWRYSYLVW